MIACDTNLLVYAHRTDSEWHEPAARVLRELAEGSAAWAIPWPCLYEFYSTVTHPKIFSPPSTPAEGLQQIATWLESPHLVLLAESPGYGGHLLELLGGAQLRGPRVHDARIAALCLFAGVRELLTADRDFSRFPQLVTRNPLVPVQRSVTRLTRPRK